MDDKTLEYSQLEPQTLERERRLFVEIFPLPDNDKLRWNADLGCFSFTDSNLCDRHCFTQEKFIVWLAAKGLLK